VFTDAANGGPKWENRSIYYLHDQTVASTSWTVAHGLGCAYVMVMVIDEFGDVIIPQGIHFDGVDGGVCTVTFNTAITGKAVCMGTYLAQA
jgi:hypothetical protein